MRSINRTTEAQIARALEFTERPMTRIAADHDCNASVVRRIAKGCRLHPKRPPMRRMVDYDTVLSVAHRLRTTRGSVEAIAHDHGIRAHVVRSILVGRSRASITGGAIERPDPPGDDYTRADWLHDLDDAVRCVSIPAPANQDVVRLLAAIDEVHLPPEASALMGMDVGEWVAIVRRDQSDGGANRRRLPAALVVVAIEIARAILANGGRLPEAESLDAADLATGRPADRASGKPARTTISGMAWF